VKKWNEREKTDIPKDERRRPVKISAKLASEIADHDKRMGRTTRTTVKIANQWYETTGCTFTVMRDFQAVKREKEKNQLEQSKLFE
jgi:hypothetical protein